MHIDEANINNLTDLWKKYGVINLEENTDLVLNVNSTWPYRCWFDWKTLSDSKINELFNPKFNSLLIQHNNSNVVPLWILDNFTGDEVNRCQIFEKNLLHNEYVCGVEQVAMYLDLHELKNMRLDDQYNIKTDLDIKNVSSAAELDKWINIISKAFEYEVDDAVFFELLKCKDIKILMAYQADQAVAGALLYKTGDVIGLYQMGVLQSLQGQGIARYLMLYLIETSMQWQGRYIVLQASKAGRALYDSLGFKAQFLIKNYKRV